MRFVEDALPKASSATASTKPGQGSAVDTGAEVVGRFCSNTDMIMISDNQEIRRRND
jgi:hypothetical protein